MWSTGLAPSPAAVSPDPGVMTRMRTILWAALLVLTPCAWGDDLAKYDARITAEDRAHWAFQPVRRPQIPKVKDASWCRNPIDRFVLARLEEMGWTPSPSPAPLALLRRIHFDLTGLPATIEEQDAFLRDSSPEALDRVVDDLLARPAYGERWARHWLDVVRFAESNGFERDATKPYAWRYRDWVIRAFNDDKPYDRFLLEQIAGDELPDATATRSSPPDSTDSGPGTMSRPIPSRIASTSSMTWSPPRRRSFSASRSAVPAATTTSSNP